MIPVFSGTASPEGCAGVTPWLVDLEVAFSVFSYFSVKCDT